MSSFTYSLQDFLPLSHTSPFATLVNSEPWWSRDSQRIVKSQRGSSLSSHFAGSPFRSLPMTIDDNQLTAWLHGWIMIFIFVINQSNVYYYYAPLASSTVNGKASICWGLTAIFSVVCFVLVFYIFIVWNCNLQEIESPFIRWLKNVSGIQKQFSKLRK